MIRDPAGLFLTQDLPFLDKIAGNLVLTFRERGSDTPAIPGMSLFFYAVNGKNIE